MFPASGWESSMKTHPPIPDFLILETVVDFHYWQSGLFFFFPPLTSCALNSGFCMLNWPIKAEPSETLGSPLPINKSRTPGLWPHSVASGEPCAFPDLWVINFAFLLMVATNASPSCLPEQPLSMLLNPLSRKRKPNIHQAPNNATDHVK